MRIRILGNRRTVGLRSNRIEKALYLSFGWLRQEIIKSRYRDTEHGKAESERVYIEARWGHLDNAANGSGSKR